MFIYTFKSTGTGADSVQKGILHQGIDWFLDETLGTSYQVLSHTLDGDMVVTECEQKPTDWVGPFFLERLEVPYRIGKRTPDGLLTHHGLWSRLLWKGGRPLTRDEVRGF
jgi:hypothetical protein